MKKMIFIGDSLTTGFGVHKNESWFNIVKKAFINFDFINKGVNGDTTTGILSRFHKDIISCNPDIVFLMVGSNDFLSGKSVEFVMDNIKILIKDLKNNNIDFIIGIPIEVIGSIAKISWSPYVDYSILNSSICCYQDILKQYCLNKNIPFFNFYKVIHDELKISEENELFIDGLHPSPYGHSLMSKEFVNVFSNLIN